MAIRINEQKMVDENTFAYEEKIKSPTSRLIEQSPTFVTYYHIDVDSSTTDAGFIDVASILGHRSPFRFDKIENFPIYGIEQIVMQISEDDQGLDTSYESEGIILPSTIKPLPNDMFIIPVLSKNYMFKINGVEYDNIMPDNFYKISFKLEFLDDEYVEKIENQKSDEFICVLENIGTESSCIIEKSVFEKISQLENMYNEITDFYIAMFYNERHNVFLAHLENGRYLYDPLQTKFINDHKLFNDKKNFQTLYLTDQYDDVKRKFKYAKSIYRYLELRKKELLSNFRYMTKPGVVLHESSFYRWHEKNIDVLDIPDYIKEDVDCILSDDFVNVIKLNGPTESDYAELIKTFLRKEDIRVKDIPLTLDEELLYLNDCMEVFFFTPIIMYIIRESIKKEINKIKN